MSSPLVIAILVFLLAFLFLIGLRQYSQWICRLSNHRQTWPLHHEQELNPSVVKSLPAFTYKHRALSHIDPLECAICLCEFQEEDTGRSLPNCSHCFHTHCIDVWFLSHSTCPLCRTSAQPPTPSSVRQAQHASLNHHNIVAGQALEQRRSFLQSQIGEGDTNPAVQPQRHAEGLIRIDLSLDSLPSQYCRSPQSLGLQFPTNVLFWGDHTHVSSRVSSLRMEHAGRGNAATTSPHVVIEIPTIQHNLLTPQSPSIVTPSCCSPSEAQACPPLTGQQPSNTPGTHLSTLKRLLSRDRNTCPRGQHMNNFSGQARASVSST